MAVVNGAFLLMYIQHIFVIIATMRYVLKQPVFNGTLQSSNHHIEIGVDVYNAQYAASSNARIGLLVRGSGNVKVQVFDCIAMAYMKTTVIVSILCFVGSIGMVLCCLGVGASTCSEHMSYFKKTN